MKRAGADMSWVWRLGVALLLSAGTPSAWAGEAWWTDFGDPLLTEAVETSLSNNPDLSVARARQRVVAAAVFQQATGSLPQLQLAAQSSWSPTESLGFGFGLTLPAEASAPKTYSSGQALLQAHWMLDLFGQNSALIVAAKRDATAALDDVRAQELSVASRVVEAYWDALVSERYLVLAQEQLSAQSSLLEALTLRFGDTDVGALDVLQQRQQVASAKVQIPRRRIQNRVALQRLAVLLGHPASTAVALTTTLPDMPHPLSEIEMSAALSRRPELLAAAKRVKSAKNRQWSAWATGLPTVAVSAQTGVQFFDNGDFQKQQTWGAGTTLTIPLFSGGRVYGGVRRARAAVMEAEATLRSLRLSAEQQVTASYLSDVEQTALLAALKEQREAAHQAWVLARDQTVQGTSPYLNVQLALSRLQQAQLALLQGRREALSSRVQLIQNLGGHHPAKETP
jgi:outer membrane protein TolC